MVQQQPKSSASLLPVLALSGLYLAFAAWLYVSYPMVLALFAGALAVIWALEATKKFLRSPVLMRARLRH